MLLGYFFCGILTESGPNPGHILDLFHEYLQCILIHLENVFVIWDYFNFRCVPRCGGNFCYAHHDFWNFWICVCAIVIFSIERKSLSIVSGNCLFHKTFNKCVKFERVISIITLFEHVLIVFSRVQSSASTKLILNNSISLSLILAKNILQIHCISAFSYEFINNDLLFLGNITRYYNIIIWTINASYFTKGNQTTSIVQGSRNCMWAWWS